MKIIILYILLVCCFVCNAKVKEVKDTITLKHRTIIVDNIIHVDSSRYIIYSKSGNNSIVYFNDIKYYTKHTYKPGLFTVSTISKNDIICEDIPKK